VPDLVPVNLDCNDSASIGRAYLRQKNEAGEIRADLHLVDSLSELKEPLDVLLATKGSTLFEHDEVTYLMEGEVSAVALMSGAPLAAPPLDPSEIPVVEP
jgi:hypothetical protein